MSYGVKVVYRNAKMERVDEKVYRLEDYTALLRNDLLRIVTDVEDVLYAANGNAAKDQWDDNTWAAFCRLKHRILDKAGSIGRLPEMIFPCPDDKGDEAHGKTVLDNKS